MPDRFAGTTALILAGGLGTRLRSVLPNTQKILAEVAGKPFIHYLLDQIVDSGVSDIVFCTGFLAAQVQECLGSTYRNASLSYSVEDAPLGTGGAVRLALPMVRTDRILILNGDSYCNVNLAAMADDHVRTGAQLTIALSRVEDTSRFGRVELAEDGNVTGFAEKMEAKGPGWVNAGIYLLERHVLESIPADRPVSVEREVFPGWIGHGLFGFRSDGQLWDIGVPDAYALAQSEFRVTS